MQIIEITPNIYGGHANQTYNDVLPDGWAFIPDEMGELENFPFGEVIAEEIDGVMTMTSWKALPMPEPEPVPDSELTPAKLREQAYNTERLITWENEAITVTEAAQLWQYYAAEGSEKANELTALIKEAKATIREKYPD